MTCLYFFRLELKLLIKRRYEVVIVIHALIIEWVALCILVGSEVNFLVRLLLLLLVLIAAKDFLDDADRREVRWMPWLELALEVLYDFLVVELLAFEPVELTEPSFAHYLATHRSLESIFSKLEVLLFILESTHCPFHSLSQVVRIVRFENKARSLLGVPVKFMDGVFKTACFESDNGCCADKEFMLDDTAWLESRWH